MLSVVNKSNKSNFNSSTQQVVSQIQLKMQLLMTSAVSKLFKPLMASIFSTE